VLVYIKAVFGKDQDRTERFVVVNLMVGGGFGMIQIKGLVFGDDFFELGFDAKGILFVGEFNKFFDLSIEPVKIVGVSF